MFESEKFKHLLEKVDKELSTLSTAKRTDLCMLAAATIGELTQLSDKRGFANRDVMLVCVAYSLLSQALDETDVRGNGTLNALEVYFKSEYKQ